MLTLRNRPLSWPLSGPEASLSRLRQRPHAEALAPADLLAVVVPIAAETLERQTQGVDVQLSAHRRVRRDHRHGRQKLDLQCSLLGSRRSANDRSRNPRASLLLSPGSASRTGVDDDFRVPCKAGAAGGQKYG